MKFLVKLLRFLSQSATACVETFVTSLPNVHSFVRVWYWRKRGYQFAKKIFIARNVYFIGIVTMDEGSSISNNCFLSGSKAGVHIGKKVMIAPNCVLVAFDHGHHDLLVPMIDQPWCDAPIHIEDDVWIGANCTITKGVRLGHGCIIGANSVITKNVEPYDIVGGVPGKIIGTRNTGTKRDHSE